MQPKPIDLLRLWYLATHDGEALQNEIRPKMEKANRTLYLDQGLLEQTQTRPAIRIRLSKQGWAFLFQHMTDPVNAQTYAAGAILTDVLSLMQRLLAKYNIDIRTAFLPVDSSPTEAPDADCVPDLSWSRFYQLWEKMHQHDGGLMLRVLRTAVPDIARDRLDRTLLGWMKQGKIAIFPIEIPASITPEDQAAAITIAGKDAHIVLVN